MNDKMHTLNQSVGAEANNNRGEFLGSVTGMMHDASGKVLEYIVLKSNKLFGRGDRFFAIPAKSPIVHISKRGKIIIHLKKDDLQFARGISANECPRPNSQYGSFVFELYNYNEDKPNTLANHSSNQQ